MSRFTVLMDTGICKHATAVSTERFAHIFALSIDYNAPKSLSGVSISETRLITC